MSREDMSSPTVTHEGLLLSCIINAMENRDVVTTDIPGSFLWINTEGTVRVRIDSILSDVLLNINPEKYRDKVVIEQVNN